MRRGQIESKTKCDMSQRNPAQRETQVDDAATVHTEFKRRHILSALDACSRAKRSASRTGILRGHPRRSGRNTRGTAWRRFSERPRHPIMRRKHVKLVRSCHECSAQHYVIVTYLFWGNRSLGCLPQLLDGPRIAPKVLLASDEENRETCTEVGDLRVPLKTEYGISAMT